jgi:hypothetical protein
MYNIGHTHTRRYTELIEIEMVEIPVKNNII